MAIEVIDELQLSSLKTSQEILMKKKETIHQLDAQILERTDDPDSLEDIILETEETQDMILETEETQDMILEKINQIDTYLQMRAMASPVLATPLPTTQPSSTSSLSTTLPQGSTCRV